MFLWKPQKIAFMRDASEYCGFHHVLASKISPYIDSSSRVCDAGCGLGYLSAALSELCLRVTAVDIEPLALSVLRENIENHGIKNIDVVEGDIAGLRPETPYDVMVFAFFGGMAEVLRAARECCSGKVILIRKNWESHRFSIAKKPLESITLGYAESSLAQLGIPYMKEIFSLQMGQPFRSLSDAAGFFRLYSRDDDPSRISENDIAEKLTVIGTGEFVYFLPSEKSVGMVVFDVKDIPEMPSCGVLP